MRYEHLLTLELIIGFRKGQPEPVAEAGEGE
jgi:hypothetical protein